MMANASRIFHDAGREPGPVPLTVFMIRDGFGVDGTGRYLFAGVTSLTGRSQCANKDLKPPLFLALVGVLIGPKLLDERIFLRVRRGGNSRVLEADRNPVIPPRIFSHMVGGSL